MFRYIFQSAKLEYQPNALKLLFSLKPLPSSSMPPNVYQNFRKIQKSRDRYTLGYICNGTEPKNEHIFSINQFRWIFLLNLRNAIQRLKSSSTFFPAIPNLQKCPKIRQLREKYNPEYFLLSQKFSSTYTPTSYRDHYPSHTDHPCIKWR